MIGAVDARVQELVERLAAPLGVGPPVRLAVLFGSAATGALRPDSDVDVAVLFQDERLGDAGDLALQSALTLAAGREVDLVRLESATTILRWQVARSGTPIVQGSPVEFCRFRARAASEYIDFAPAFQFYGELFRRRLAESGSRR
jgi:predicted nucleotidyltransferase